MMREGQTREGFWMCPCGKENRGRTEHCVSCGRSRDKTTKFYLESRGDKKLGEVIKDYKRTGQNWVCDHCGAMNTATVTHCKNCGNERDHEDSKYFDLHPDRMNSLRKPEEFSDDDDNTVATGLTSSGRSNNHTDDTDTEYHSDRSDSIFHGTDRGTHFSLPSINWSAIMKIIGIVICVALVVIGAIAIFAPKERDLTVETKSWVSRVTVEEYRTVHESDWYVPSGGRITSSYSAIHHYDTVLDHYETVEVARTRTVPDGGHWVDAGWGDNGDGTFTQMETWVQDYRTEIYYETEQRPVYVQEPVYQTKYEYDIERWVFDHYETTRGGDTEPYYAEVTTDSTHRIGGYSTELSITASYYSGEEKKTESFSLDYQDWQSLQIGQEVHAKVHFGNRVELIFDDQ